MSQDAKKEEFKKYLEKAGVLEVLTKSLVSLYEEPDKPGDAVNYLKKSVGGTDNDKAEIDRLQSENTDLKSKVSDYLSWSPLVLISTFKIAAMEEKQAALEAKLAGLEKTPAGETETAPVSMEESVEAPASVPTPTPAPAEEVKAPEPPAVEEAASEVNTEKPADPEPVTVAEEPKSKSNDY